MPGSLARTRGRLLGSGPGLGSAGSHSGIWSASLQRRLPRQRLPGPAGTLPGARTVLTGARGARFGGGSGARHGAETQARC